MLQVKLRQIKIAGLSNFQVRRRPGDHRNRRACAFDNAGLISSEKTVCHGFREGAFQKAAAEALRRLRLHNVLARDGCSDESAVSRALYLFDGVHSGKAHDGSVMFFNGFNGSSDGSWGTQRTHGVVYQHNVTVIALDSIESIGHAFLARIATGDDPHFAGKAVIGHLGLHPLALIGADRDKYRADLRYLSECAQAVDEDRHSCQFKKLLWRGRRMLARGHARAQSCCWKNNENPHKHWSIQEAAQA